MDYFIRRYLKSVIWGIKYLVQYPRAVFMSSSSRGNFVVTIDVETAADFVHWMDYSQALKKGVTCRTAIKKVSDYVEAKRVPVTWFCTGHSLLTGCHGHSPRIYSWATSSNGFQDRFSRIDWFADDPQSNYKTRPDWYFGDIFKSIAKDPLSEIGSHTFGHLRMDLVSQEEFDQDMADLTVVFAGNRTKMVSHAYPWNIVNFLDHLRKYGIRRTRVKEGNFPSMIKEPKQKNTQLIFYQSFEGRPASYWCMKLGVNLAVMTGQPFVWLIHPDELSDQRNFAIFTKVCEYVLSLRDSGRIKLSRLSDVN